MYYLALTVFAVSTFALGVLVTLVWAERKQQDADDAAKWTSLREQITAYHKGYEQANIDAAEYDAMWAAKVKEDEDEAKRIADIEATYSLADRDPFPRDCEF